MAARKSHRTQGRVILAVVPFFVAPVIEVVAYLQGRDVNPVPILIATVVFVVLAGARALMLLAVRNRVQAELASTARRFQAMALNSSDAVLLLDAGSSPPHAVAPRRSTAAKATD